MVALSVLAGENAFVGVGTGPGIAVGAWLAALSWAATSWALRGQALARERLREILGRAGVAGFAAGAAFLPGVLLGIMVATRSFEGASALVLAIGMPFAGAVGSLLAILLALVDVGLYVAVARVLRVASA